MNFFTSIAVAVLAVSCVGLAFAQADLFKSEGITSELHRASVGRVTFMDRPIPLESYKEADFLTEYELKETGDLNIRVFMADSLGNYLHRLAPELSGDDLFKQGNYRFTFFLDNSQVYSEELHTGAGLPEAKRTRTILRAPLMSTKNEDSWGTFLWTRFMLNGGEEALTRGDHVLRIELRPYIKTPELKVGELIATGELKLKIKKPEVPESRIAIQSIAPGSGWTVSTEAYDRDKIREMNLKIADNVYKDLTSIVVIKNGKLLIEEYFNGSARDRLNDTRSVGKSFASTLMGIAIGDRFIKSEDQTLGDFYDLKKFANYSAKKDSVTLKSLLTMSSGFTGNDDDETSPGNEEKMYPTSDWVKFALDLPMDDKKEVGKTWNYFTAGVVVLGDILNRSVPGGMEKYADRRLFKPLGITRYQWEFTPQKVPNTAGGLRLTSVDLAKFGQLYKNGGKWNGKQVIPQEWVDKTFTNYLNIPYDPTWFYGYLFWNITFKVEGRPYEAYYATGNGGNKILIFKDHPLVVVITATAYGKPYAHPQAGKVMEKYILPAVLAK